MPIVESDKPIWMAYNHNGTPLMSQPTRKAEAQTEADAYREATGNASYVDHAE